MAQDVSFRRITSALGAEVSGVDLRRDVGEDVVGRIREGLLAHQVLFFRGQDLTDDEHVAFAKKLGPLIIYPIARVAGSTDPLTTIENDAEHPPTADEWHTDVTWLAEPPRFAVISARDVPDHGGDTLWASLYRLYDALSPALRTLCDGISVTHTASETFFSAARRMVGDEKADQIAREYPPAVHPLVRLIPESGRKALFVSNRCTENMVGMSTSEGRMLAGHFRGLLDDPNNHVRWRWQPNDLVIWDERCTNHRALSDYYPQHRRMRRCTVGSEAPQGVDARASSVT